MLYYSHVNEDNRIERNLLHSFNCPEAVVVAGSGERVLALMDCVTCKRFSVVDINEEALFLVQLKLTVLDNFTVTRYLQFIGHKPETAEVRLQHFDEMKHLLQANCRLYWEQRKGYIKKGILYAGHFEKFLGRVRPLVNFFLGSTFLKIFDRRFQLTRFTTWKWKVVAFMFSQTFIYRFLGNKDIAFISRDVNTKNIPDALNTIIYSGKACSSFIAHPIFKGHLNDMIEEHLPPSLQEKILIRIKERLRTKDIIIDYYSKDLLAFTKCQLSTSNIFYSISDILSFQDQYYLNELLEKMAVPGCIVVSRSFLRNRLTSIQLEELAVKYQTVAIHDHQDSTGMYQVFLFVCSS